MIANPQITISLAALEALVDLLAELAAAQTGQASAHDVLVHAYDVIAHMTASVVTDDAAVLATGGTDGR